MSARPQQRLQALTPPKHEVTVADDGSDYGKNWSAVCTCGWSSNWCGSKEWAEYYAAGHRAGVTHV